MVLNNKFSFLQLLSREEPLAIFPNLNPSWISTFNLYICLSMAHLYRQLNILEDNFKWWPHPTHHHHHHRQARTLYTKMRITSVSVLILRQSNTLLRVCYQQILRHFWLDNKSRRMSTYSNNSDWVVYTYINLIHIFGLWNYIFHFYS